ncbi:MAG: hypothetical protein JRF33_10375 [Deltaproteobacteria bacterium]|nr:hypothetical protein [Deltaproteobacteria bacterium]
MRNTLLGTLILSLFLLTNFAMADEQEESQEIEPTGLEATFEVVDDILGDRNPIALIRPEGTGALMNLQGLERWWIQALERKPERVVLDPDRVLRLAGLEFAESAQGIGGVAKRCGTDAAIFLQIIFAENRYELMVLVADDEGLVLLDKTFLLPELPQAPKLDESGQPEQVETPLADMQPMEVSPKAEVKIEQPVEETPVGPSPEERFARRALVFEPGPGEKWGLVQGTSGRISELSLAEMAGDQATLKKLNTEVNALRFNRNLGIGLTLSGAIISGLSMPLLKEQNEGLTAGGVVLGLGLATAIAGGVLWYIYGPKAKAADSPYPRKHMLSRAEARRLVQMSNDILRRELGLDKPPAPEPEKVAPKPEKVAPKPEKVAPKPEKVAPKPEKVAPKPEKVTPEPEKVTP